MWILVYKERLLTCPVSFKACTFLNTYFSKVHPFERHLLQIWRWEELQRYLCFDPGSNPGNANEVHLLKNRGRREFSNFASSDCQAISIKLGPVNPSFQCPTLSYSAHLQWFIAWKRNYINPFPCLQAAKCDLLNSEVKGRFSVHFPTFVSSFTDPQGYTALNVR